jgi:hypothetical protein
MPYRIISQKAGKNRLKSGINDGNCLRDSYINAKKVDIKEIYRILTPGVGSEKSQYLI